MKTPSPRPLKGSLFWLALLLQVSLVALLPTRKALTLATGTLIYLQIAPRDPYDPLRGRYVTLSYAVAQLSTLKKLPGWSPELRKPGILYLRLAPPAGDPAQPWQAVGISRDRPRDLRPGEVVLQGWFDGWQLRFGIEEFFLPEALGEVLEEAIRHRPETLRAEVKVDPWGKAALVGLWAGERRY
ncbi:GDYXXLXY domain-containing protein [Synechococcus sp. H70.2]|uniref:GDYXXLXY domain-containing protein n=1 Tax=unclassified Synechococcus TaxID=2626047 RepID=UPI0039C498B1